MKKIDIGGLAVQNMTTNEVIEFLGDNLPLAVDALIKAVASQNMGAVGMSAATLTNYVSIIKALNKKVNGEKEKTVL